MGAMGRSDRPLRLAVTTYYLPSESKIGVGWVAHRLANELVALGHHVTVFSPCARPDDAVYDHELVPVQRPYHTLRWGFAMRRLDLSGFDALLAQGDDHFIRRGSVPAHIRTLHGSCFDEARFVPGLKNRARMVALGLTEVVAAVRTPHVVGVSHASLRFFPWLHDVIPNGVDVGRFTPGAPEDKEERPTILFVGTYLRRKRGKLLQDVFTEYIRPRIPDAQLWMVCSDAPAAPGVEVLGRISDDELADRYRRAWVFALPSTYEGFGVPYIEAMASGTAVVATPNPGAYEVLKAGQRGMLAAPMELGPALLDVLVDTGCRRELERLGLTCRDEYGMRRVAQDYVARVEQQLRSPG